MNRLQTYFALLSSLLTLLTCAVVVLVGILLFGADPSMLLLVLPACCITFVISLIVGHFLTEPLAVLCSKVQIYQSGNHDVSFETDGRLYEADRLSECFADMAEKNASQQADLLVHESRKSDFVSDVAHELRTPLTAIRGNAEMLLDPDLPDSLHEKFCTIIIRESERLTRLTNDLLTLQRIEGSDQGHNLARVNLKTLATEVVDTLAPVLRERDAQVSVTGEAPDVLGNSDNLKQVISNLLDNASRFIKPGGHIDIDLFGLNNNAVITVRDDGEGFGDVDPKLLFGRFYRADASRTRGTGGTGLGLAIVKSIVEAHDGTVEAVNLPEGGACFIVAIPAIMD